MADLVDDFIDFGIEFLIPGVRHEELFFYFIDPVGDRGLDLSGECFEHRDGLLTFNSRIIYHAKSPKVLRKD